MGKILKGKVTIQLFDAKTGKEVERREGHNIITNAAHFLTNGAPYGLDRRTWGLDSATQETDWSRIYDKVFGGILIFPNTIAESASHIFEPLSNYPVGYASMDGQDLYDPKAGTFSGSGSTPITEGAKGYSYVYEFGTSQGNGTWETVCLTSAKGGYGYVEGRTDGTIFDSFFKRTISGNYIGSTSNYIYFISSMYNAATLSRLAIPPFEVHLYGNDIKGTPSTALSVNDTDRIFIDQANDCIYKLEINGQNLTITRYNDEEDLTDTTVFTLSDIVPTVPAYNRGRFDFCVKEGYLYMGNRGNKVLKMNLNDKTDFEEITVTTHSHTYSLMAMSLLPTGDIYRYPDIIDENDVVHTIGSADTTGYNYDCAFPFNNWAVRSSGHAETYDNGYAGSINTIYLATIKNLAEPLIKDTTKTAKITYELTEVNS